MSRKSTSAASKSNNFMGSEDGWNQASTKELLQKMKMAIPKPDVIKYKTMLSKLDWEKIQFGKFSVKDCQDQWTRVYKKLKKFKTLSDLVSESFEYIENPYKGNVKKHPDHPKRPLTPYFRFFLGEREKYAKLHKDLTNLEITNILSKKYREISIEEKENLESKWRGQMIEYKKQLEEFKKNHPEYYDKSPPKVSRTPIAIFNQEQIVAMTRSKKKMSKKQLQESLKNKYHDLDDDQKLPYILKAIEEWEKYKEELEMYKKSHQEFVPTDRYTKSVLTISDWRIHDKNLGRPDRPPANGYNLFCTRMMVSDSMKHLSSRDRIMQCGQKWKLLTDAEKAAYQEEFLKMRDNYRTAQKNFLSSLTPRQREEYLERKKETETKRNLKRKIPIQIKAEVPSESDSDESDDEEMEVNDDSSSESSSSESSDEEEEEEEPSAKKTKSPSPTTKITSPAPLRPTTPISALFLYQKAHREKFAAKHPNVSKNDITIMLARRFNNLPQEKKAKYIQKEKEQRALYNEQMRKHLLGESAKKDAPAELRPVTGEQIFQEQSKAAYLKKAGGSEEKAQEIMRKAWTQMNKERRKKYINIAHEQNAKNIAQHQAAVAASKKQNENVAEPAPPVERNLSQKEIKSYLALEPKKVPNNGLLLFKMEHRVKLNHLKPSARTQELSRLWEASSQADKNKYKEKAKTGMAEYNKKIQRWIKSLPPQALEVYKAKLAKSKTKQAASKASVANGGAKKRKAETAQTKASKKSKKEESEESSDDSSDDDDSSSDSDDDSDSSDSDDSSDDSSSSDEDALPANQSKKQESSGDSSSSDEDDSGSD